MAALLMVTSGQSFAASSAGCDGGGFTLLGVSGKQDITIPVGSFGNTFLVRGKYVEFTVDAATLGVLNWTLTGAPNPLDITGGVRTPIFASKLPDHRGLALTSGIVIKMDKESLVLSRTGTGLSMKIQVKDCSNGGLFQMEVERGDATATVFTHVLSDGIFYYDNPNVRDRLGERIPCSGVLPDGSHVNCVGANADGTVTVTARINFSNDFSNKFVGRDSPQLATRIGTGCPNTIPNPAHPGTVNHCGGVSQWSVESGGRMGQVMGEDAVEIAPAATPCNENCTAMNQVNGRAVVVGFPFPVPEAVRLKPRFFSGFLPPATNPGDVIITEFRFRGPAGARDEFVELYNNTDSKITVSTADGSAGWSLVTSDGTTRLTIPNGTAIPARAHYLATGSGNTTLTDSAIATDLPDSAGLALFRTANVANFDAANRLDAVGFTTSSTLYRAGSGITTGTGIAENAEFSFVRKFQSANGLPQATNDNAADFELISTTGANLSGRNSVLGTPSPESLRSPLQRNNTITASLIDPTTSRLASPNLVRVGSGNSGTLSFRRQFTNNTGATVTQLQFRVIDITTMNSPVVSGPQADFRLTTSNDTTASTGLGPVTVKGTSLSATPTQTLGGGLNTPLQVTLPAGGLAPGQSINVQFLMNVIQNGKFRFYINVEALP